MKTETGLKLACASSLALLIFAAISCGRPDDADSGASSGGGSFTTVNGLAAYGTQCPYGSISGVKPLRLQLWNCPLGTDSVDLAQNIKPLFLEADCKDRILSVRTQDRQIDTSWYFLPDGEFDVVVNGLSAYLRSDGSRSNCTTPLAINLYGKVDCGASESSLDKATIDMQSVMWAGLKPSAHGTSAPAPRPSASPGLPPPPVPVNLAPANLCSMPQSCYFYTQTELKQCP